MLWNNVKFQVLTVQTEEAIRNVSAGLRKLGVKIIDVRQTDIVNSETNAVESSCYILICSSKKQKFQLLSEHYGNEIIYEGYKTLY